ncbi:MULTISPECIES: hypothetical protein [Halolamina]|uniref:Uncharacterized protein n=1 Tax=Halolamina pelagica TaxID=699431 RepID=A0A1I5TXS3_9EURY|nr:MULTISPECIES: hypothetical protein [Halolamina]NHX36696.1 hypothetical protein [Halolamina sp. R1-12]SFP87862.1 hypothetical protein SAMN05216277_11111 [Halolamina pelagica]
MSKTVDELRNEIRVGVGRYERQVSSGFTKEALAALCESLDADVETAVIPGKDVMRQAISDEVAGVDSSRDQTSGFRKGELEAIAAELDED